MAGRWGESLYLGEATRETVTERVEKPSEPGLLATVDRGLGLAGVRPESWHHGWLVAVGADGVLRAVGDPEQRIWVRSAIKPLQALPLLEMAAERGEEFSDAELAVMAASHGGTERHVQAVRALLARGAFDEDALRCGPHLPFDPEARRALLARGEEPRPIHNNCSGKHAGFLLLARALGVPPEHYADPEGPVQTLVRRVVAETAGVAFEDLDVGLDGCGAPTLRLSLRALAEAFRRFATGEGLPPARARAATRLSRALVREPVLAGVEGRLTTELLRCGAGRVLGKNGAEGVFAAGVRDLGLGLSVKIADGADRAVGPTVVEALVRLGVWDAPPRGLDAFHDVPVYNTQGILVGHVRSAFTW